MRRNSRNIYIPHGTLDYEENGALIEGTWRKDTNMSSLLPLRQLPRRPSAGANQIRDEIADYCVREGTVPWQENYV